MNILYRCSTQYENLGDLIINLMLIKELSKYGKVYIDTYGIPDKFAIILLTVPNTTDLYKKHGVTAKKGLKSLIEIIVFCKKNKIKLITDSPGPSFSQRHGLVNILKNLVRNFLFKCTCAKIYAIGKCCSSFISKQKRVYNFFYDGYYLRSFDSVDFLSYYKKSVYYIPDLCFLMPTYHDTTIKKDKAIVDIRLINGQEEQLLHWCKLIIDQLIKQGFSVEIYYQVERDYSSVHMLYEYLHMSNVTIREDVVWYEDLKYYEDKKFVISNRLHSLLIGAAYAVYPLCVYQEAVETLKLKHVFCSSFTEDLHILQTKYEEIDYKTLYDENIIRLHNQFVANRQICVETIRNMMNNI